MNDLATTASRAIDTLTFDHLEFYVGNARQAAYYFCAAFGFEHVAYAGPETGVMDRASYVLAQADVRFVLTSALSSRGPIADFVARHGDGVRDVAFATADAPAAYHAAVANGAIAAAVPDVREDAQGMVRTAAIQSYGDTIHTFIERGDYQGVWRPGYVAASSGLTAKHPVGLVRIDHCVGNVGPHEMDRWCDYYKRALGFSQLVSFDDADISTEHSALRSRVMQNASGAIKLPINEPAPGRRKSQIEEYLDAYGGPGVQHIAIATNDIIAAVAALRANGVRLLPASAAYYDTLAERVGAIAEDIDVLRELAILVDRDDRGYMLQIFTQPLNDRPTIFIEIIQRRGSLSFGKGNFKALFVSMEQEQARRGNL